jgi:hypothetical protein
MNLTIFALLLSFVIGPPTSRSTSAFLRLQSLAGEWEGKDERANPVKTSFKRIVSNTTVMETLAMHASHEMITLYSLDADGIALLHYCPTNNQPRMRAVPAPGELKELSFTFQGAGNLATASTGHEHKLVLQFQDKEHITERWTWREKGKDTEMVYQFTRKTEE